MNPTMKSKKSNLKFRISVNKKQFDKIEKLKELFYNSSKENDQLHHNLRELSYQLSQLNEEKNTLELLVK